MHLPPPLHAHHASICNVVLLRSAIAAAMASSPGPSSASKPASVDPVLRNTLRYTISAREYATLHKYILSRSKTLRRAAPTPASVDKALRPQQEGADDYNAKAVRHALRIFLATMAGIKGWEAISKRLGLGDGHGHGHGQGHGPGKQPSRRSPALRLSASLSSILLLYRFLFRFFSRLRAHLLDPQAEPFRRRNPRTVAALTSASAPAVGASLAGVALGVLPSQQLRASVAIYAMFRALEFAWNMCEAGGLVWGLRNGKKRERPWWFGSWLLQPLAFGQLLHAVVLDRDCFPAVSVFFVLFIFSPPSSAADTGVPDHTIIIIIRPTATSSSNTRTATSTPPRQSRGP